MGLRSFIRRFVPSEVRTIVTDAYHGLKDAAPDIVPKAPEITIPPPDLGPTNTLIAQQTEAIRQAEAEQQRLAAELVKAQELTAKRAEETKAAFEKAMAPVEKPAPMPSPTSSEVRQAARRRAASLQRRGGRQSTILTDQDFLGG